MKRSLLLPLALAACSGEKDATVYDTGVPLVLNPPLPKRIGPNRRTPLPQSAIRFGDWAVTCERRATCTAVSLPPRRGWGDRYEVKILGHAQPKRSTAIMVRALGRKPPSEMTLVVDGEIFAAPFLEGGETTLLEFEADVGTLAQGRKLLVYDSRSSCEGFCPPPVVPTYYIPKTGAPPRSVSLRGLGAALQYMERRLASNARAMGSDC